MRLYKCENGGKEIFWVVAEDIGAALAQATIESHRSKPARTPRHHEICSIQKHADEVRLVKEAR
jgi:hypothetical protein